MSDGSLSQDEIDALLLGGSVESPEAGGALQSGASLLASEESALMSLLVSASESQSATLSGMMGKAVIPTEGLGTIISIGVTKCQNR